MMISTGIKYLDKLTGGLKLGDNVVWEVSNAVPVEYFIKSFFTDSKSFDKTIIYINFNNSPYNVCTRYDELCRNHNAILIDAFSHGKGKSDPVFLSFYKNNPDYDLSRIICLENPQDTGSFIETMNEVNNNNKDGCFYIFDSLTGMNELWKDETALLDFFGFTCPKLYDLNTIAYWIYEKDAHSKKFSVSLAHITQVIFSVSKTNPDFFELNILKMENRPTIEYTGPHQFKIIDGTIHFQLRKTEDLLGIGEKLKELRKSMNITQAELASYLEMTPGAISQIENAVISPSLHTLMQISTIFGKPLEYFIKSGERGTMRSGYTIYTTREAINTGNHEIQIQKLIEENIIKVKPFSITIGAGQSQPGPILMHKGMEYLIVVRGSITVTIDGEEQTIKKGDSILLTTSFIEKWHNSSKSVCELIYILF